MKNDFDVLYIVITQLNPFLIPFLNDISINQVRWGRLPAPCNWRHCFQKAKPANWNLDIKLNCTSETNYFQSQFHWILIQICHWYIYNATQNARAFVCLIWMLQFYCHGLLVTRFMSWCSGSHTKRYGTGLISGEEVIFTQCIGEVSIHHREEFG